MKNKNTYIKILKLVKPKLWLMILSTILALFSVATSLYLPILTGQAIDNMVDSGHVNMPAILNILKYFLISLMVNGISSFLMTLINNRVTFSIVNNLRDKMFEKLHKVPVSYIDKSGHGDLLSRMINDVDRLSDGLLLGFSQLFTGIITIIGTLIFMFFTNALITVVVVILTPVSLFVASFISKKTYTHFSKQAKLQGEMTGYINESIKSVRVIKAFGAEGLREGEFDEINSSFARVNLKALFYSSITNPSTRFVNGLVYSSVGIFGSILGVKGKLTIGTLSCFLSYANQYTKPFNEISGVVTEFQNAVASAGRIFEFLDSPETPDKYSDNEATTFDASRSETVSNNLSGDIEIQNLCFSYDKAKKLLYDISFKVKKGSHIAIVGPTGCGKTTFINLLMRFYEPDSGNILFDGRKSSEISKAELRKNIGMVLQDTWLKEATIAENISYGVPDATREDIIKAAKEAHAHSFIMRLEKGYDTPVTADGGNLSAGQKQLLCIARVMLSLPPILILDEATSSIDTRTEIKITDAFKTLMKGRTSFIVAHRLSTIKNADLILVMKDGNIIEQGTDEELISKRGFYYEMLNS